MNSPASFLVLALALSAVWATLDDDEVIEAVESGSQQTRCYQDTICRWAVCQWRRSITPNRRECQFVNFDCACPSNTSCQRTSTVKPGPHNIVTFYYQCRA